MRVFCGALATESNTFGPMPTGLDSFSCYRSGQCPAEGTFFSGPVWAARKRGVELGWTVIEGMVAEALPGGTTTRHAYESLREEILGDLRAALPVDLVLLGLHGAMVADGYDDCEGDLLERVRGIVGPDVVVGAELDPHCHLSERMIHNTDILVAFKEYPHTDVLERAIELVDLCASQVQGKIHAVAAMADCNMVVTLHTSREPARGLVDRIQALEGKDGLLSISLAHGFPWGDVPDMGTKVLVYANGDAQKAQQVARRLADEMVSRKAEFAIPYVDLDTALDQARAAPDGPTVIADCSDNAGGGAASDSTYLLRRIVERGISNVAIGPIWDPIAVRIAFEAGAGARLAMRIGGKVGPLSGDPIDLVCTVKALRTDLVMTGVSGTPSALGNCALVEANGVEIVLATLRDQAMATDMFTQLGCDPGLKDIVVVKSVQHFYASFSKVARRVIYASGPGSVALDFTSLAYSKVRRPLWPLDKAHA